MKICNRFMVYLILYFGFKEYANANSDFTLTVDRADVLYYNESYCYVNVSARRVSRALDKAIFFFLRLYVDAPPQTTATLTFVALLGNVYRSIPIVIKRNICDSLGSEYQWIREQVEAVDHKFPTSCPIKKGDIYVSGLIPSAKNFPQNANFPWDKMTLTLEYSALKLKFFALIAYLNFDHDAKLKAIG